MNRALQARSQEEVCCSIPCVTPVQAQSVSAVQDMHQLLNDSATDNTDLRHKFLALGDMLRRQHNTNFPVSASSYSPSPAKGHEVPGLFSTEIVLICGYFFTPVT